MQHIGEIKKHFERKPAKITSERSELIERFFRRLNPSRVRAGYKPLTPAALGVMLSHIKKPSDLHAFYRQCEEARNFSAYFWWAIKPSSQQR